MGFLSSRSLSPHNAFGARLTLVNYPPAGRPSGASEMPPVLKSWPSTPEEKKLDKAVDRAMYRARNS